MTEDLLTEVVLPDPAGFDHFHPFIKGVFSQWHPTTFVIEGETFVTAEQWMMVCKARLFGDAAAAEAIMRTSDPAEQKRLGQRVVGFEQEPWDARRLGIVHAGSLAKFQQNEGARRQLAATAPAMLVEANPRDWIWGNGLQIDDPANNDPARWKGSNFLGRILTLVRNQLT